MSEIICPDCGERNAGPVEFCAACGAFLAWDAGDAGPAEPEPAGVGRHAAGASTMPVPQHHLLQPAREWGAAQLGESGFELPTRTDRPGPVLRAEPVPSLSDPPEPPAPADRVCPRCGVHSDAGLRFCRKCGLARNGPSRHDDGPGRPRPAPERRPWWRRWFRPGDNTRRAARSAFRHSLPLRYRLVRWVLGLLGIGAIIGALTLIGQNPVRWVTDRVNDLRGSLVQVDGLRAYNAPQDGADQVQANGIPPAPAAGSDVAQNVLDNRSDTAWSTPWSAGDQPAPSDAPCVAPSTPSAAGAPGSILIVPGGPVTVQEISIAPGRAKSDTRRPLEWRPKTIQLAFSDGTCQQITLDDSDALQPKQIEPVETTQIRLSVVNAYSPESDQPTDVAAISDIVLYQRP